MKVDMEVVAQVLKGLKQDNAIDGYWNIKEAMTTTFDLSNAQANELFGEPDNKGGLVK